MVNGDEKAWNRCCKRQFNNHDAIERRGGEHHDAAQRCLNQA